MVTAEDDRLYNAVIAVNNASVEISEQIDEWNADDERTARLRKARDDLDAAVEELIDAYNAMGAASIIRWRDARREFLVSIDNKGKGIVSKYTVRYLKPERLWEVSDKSHNLYTAAETPDGWGINNGLRSISPTGKLGRSIIAAVEAAILQQSSDTLMALALIDESRLDKRES